MGSEAITELFLILSSRDPGAGVLVGQCVNKISTRLRSEVEPSQRSLLEDREKDVFCRKEKQLEARQAYKNQSLCFAEVSAEWEFMAGGCDANEIDSFWRSSSGACRLQEVRSVTKLPLLPVHQLTACRYRLREAPHRAVHQRERYRAQLRRSPHQRRPPPHPLVAYCPTAPAHPHLHPGPPSDFPERMGRVGVRNVQPEGAISAGARGARDSTIPARCGRPSDCATQQGTGRGSGCAEQGDGY